RRRVLVLVGAPDADGGAGPRQALGHAEADPAIAAGHPRHVAGEIESRMRHRSPFSREADYTTRAGTSAGGAPSPLGGGPSTRLAVADELHVAVAGDGLGAAGAAPLPRALPVTRAHVELLVGQPWREGQLETAGEVGQPPAGGVLHEAVAAPPR